MNLAHPVEDYETVTEIQRREILPHLRSALTGRVERVLDFGCGPGRFTGELAALTGAETIGVDPVPEFLALAPKSARVTYRKMEEGSLPLPDQSVDVAFACLVLGGLTGATLTRSVQEIQRVLRSHGLLFLVENTSEKPSPAHWRFRQYPEYAQMFPTVALSHLHAYWDLGERISVMSGRKRSADRDRGTLPAIALSLPQLSTFCFGG
jgi:SAM-dependent methyltransferase